MPFTRENSHHSPIANILLSALPMVEEVTIGHAFVTVRKVLAEEAAHGAKEFTAYFVEAHGESIRQEEEAIRTAGAGGTVPSSPTEDACHSVASLPEEQNTSSEKRHERLSTCGVPASSSSSAAPFTETISSDGVSFSSSGESPLEEEAIVSMIKNTTWEDLKMHISALLTDYLYSGAPPLSLDAPPPHQDTIPQEGDSEVVLAIKELVRSAIRPLLQQDGGDIRLEGFNAETGEMRVELLGACRRCHSRHHTLGDLIERTTRYWIPEVTQVVAMERHGTRHGWEATPSVNTENTTITPTSIVEKKEDEGDLSCSSSQGVDTIAETESEVQKEGVVDMSTSRACLRIEGSAQLVRHIKKRCIDTP